MRGCLRYALLAVLVLACGYLLPGVLIPDGVNTFEGEDRDRAEAALSFERPNLDTDDPDPLIRALTTTAYRVEEAGPCGDLEPEKLRAFANPDTGMTVEEGIRNLREEQPEEARDWPLDVFVDDWHYRVRLYTVFGIPYATESFSRCDERGGADNQ